MADDVKPRRAGKRERPAPRRYAPAGPAMQKMMDAAETVLIRDGYHAFSTRRVAEECGVSLGHLTYYFPAKDDLLRAMISSLMARYRERMGVASGAATARTVADLRSIVEWFVRDAVTMETSGLFRELWVLSKHDAFVAQQLSGFYGSVIESFAELAASLYPSIGIQRLRDIGYLIAMLTEGGTVLFAGRGERSASFADVCPMAVDTAMRLLESEAAAAQRTETSVRAARRRKRP